MKFNILEMTKELQTFLEQKGVEFCYSDSDPFPVHRGAIDYEWIIEFYETRNGDLKTVELSEFDFQKQNRRDMLALIKTLETSLFLAKEVEHQSGKVEEYGFKLEYKPTPQ